MNEIRELHYRYNFFYLAAILLITIVVLITVEWGGIKGLVDYISFGLTLTSLFLALIAIVYAIISNTTFSQHLGTLRSVTQTVVDASGGLSKITNTLDAKLAELPTLIRNVETKIDETRKDLLEGVAQRAKTKDTETLFSGLPKGLDTDAFFSSFISQPSFNGLAALYTA